MHAIEEPYQLIEWPFHLELTNVLAITIMVNGMLGAFATALVCWIGGVHYGSHFKVVVFCGGLVGVAVAVLMEKIGFHVFPETWRIEFRARGGSVPRYYGSLFLTIPALSDLVLDGNNAGQALNMDLNQQNTFARSWADIGWIGEWIGWLGLGKCLIIIGCYATFLNMQHLCIRAKIDPADQSDEMEAKCWMSLAMDCGVTGLAGASDLCMHFARHLDRDAVDKVAPQKLAMKTFPEDIWQLWLLVSLMGLTYNSAKEWQSTLNWMSIITAEVAILASVPKVRDYIVRYGWPSPFNVRDLIYTYVIVIRASIVYVVNAIILIRLYYMRSCPEHIFNVWSWSCFS